MHHISCRTQKLWCPVNHMYTSHSQKHQAQTRWSCTCLIKHHATKVFAVASFMPWLVYPWYLQNTQLRGPQSHSGHYREKKIVCPSWEWNADSSHAASDLAIILWNLLPPCTPDGKDQTFFCNAGALTTDCNSHPKTHHLHYHHHYDWKVHPQLAYV